MSRCFAGGVKVYTNRVDTAFNGKVKALFQLGLVNVVLILSYADAFRVNLYKFSQRVHKSPAYAYGTAHGYVLVGKLLARSLLRQNKLKLRLRLL